MRIDRTKQYDIYSFSKEEVEKIKSSRIASTIATGVMENTGDGGAKITLLNNLAARFLSKRVEKIAEDLNFEFTGEKPLQVN